MTVSAQVFLSFTEHKKDLFGRRVGAMMIDYVLLAGVLLLADGLLGNELYQRTLWIWLPLCFLYYPLLEGRYGATLGKKIMALRVVSLDLSPCGYRRSVIRFLVRLIDTNLFVPIFALFGYLSFQKTPLRQRWGDIAAKTLVVRIEDLKEPIQLPEPMKGKGSWDEGQGVMCEFLTAPPLTSAFAYTTRTTCVAPSPSQCPGSRPATAHLQSWAKTASRCLRFVSPPSSRSTTAILTSL